MFSYKALGKAKSMIARRNECDGNHNKRVHTYADKIYREKRETASTVTVIFKS